MTAWLAGAARPDPEPGRGRARIDTPWLAGLRIVSTGAVRRDERDVRRGGSGQAPDRDAPPLVVCRVATSAADRALHHEIRRAVFVGEQRVFEDSDHDPRDDDPATLHVLGLVDGVAAGTVRLFRLDDPTGPDWQGDRLAVLPPFRSAGLGAPLVRFAVATAAALGGRRMLAHVQPPNRTFFRRLGWTQRGEPELYVGRPHLLMDIDLRPVHPSA